MSKGLASVLCTLVSVRLEPSYHCTFQENIDGKGEGWYFSREDEAKSNLFEAKSVSNPNSD